MTSQYQRGGNGARQIQVGRRYDEPTGCLFLAILVWLISAAVVVGFWGLVAYGIWTGIQYLQTH